MELKNETKNRIYQLVAIGFILIFVSCSKKDNRNAVTDIDGNVYKTVVIGKYEWMAENLKTTTYNNGTKIPNVTVNRIWLSLASGAYSKYNNSKSSVDTFGLLYNWYAVNTGKLCPCGWHVPSDEEWKYLEGFVDTKYGVGNPVWNDSGLRGYDAGLRLKAISGWRIGLKGTDSFGFSALPGGEYLRRFHSRGTNGFWWSSTENNASTAWFRDIIYSFGSVSRNSHPKNIGFSVRCVRDKKK